MDLMKRVEQTVVPEQKVAIFWLGQAGFLLKTHDGHTIVIDPYLSNYVERLFPETGLGFKRLMPPPCAPEDVCADVLLISHEHVGDNVISDTQYSCGECEYCLRGEYNSCVHVQFACVDGPEFDGHLVDFDEAMNRQTLYKTEEGRALLALREGEHHGGCCSKEEHAHA